MKDIVNYIYEMYQLKALPRHGWQRAHVKNPESIAEHILLASHIGYLLADMEGADRTKVLEMIVFHENGEARIGDVDKLAARYDPDKQERERKAMVEQLQRIPEHLANRIVGLFDEMEEAQTLEAKVVKDADYIECAFQANIYYKQGNPWLADWVKNVGNALRTDSGKKLFDEMLATDPFEWIQGLKRLDNL